MGTTLSVEEWIEELNKHDSFGQYAKRRRERREEETEDESNPPLLQFPL